MTQLRFSQVDVFASGPLSGNPVAVVHDASGCSDDEMQRFARWTNLSETTFLLPPTSPEADYRLRIFTPGEELPFAGHPTLGSAHAWLAAGGVPRTPGVVIQECGVGLIEIRVDGDALAFAAPRLLRSGPVDGETRAAALEALGLRDDEVRHVEWLDNGPAWIGAHLDSVGRLHDIVVNYEALGNLEVGAIAPHEQGGPADFEIRAFDPHIGEDPVTGSLNAGFAMAMYGDGRVAGPITVRQGTCVGAAGEVSWTPDGDGRIWIGGATTTVVSGTVEF